MARTKEQYNVYMRGYTARIKEDVFNHYGRACACCGETDQNSLCIDHASGGGNQHRRDLGVTAGRGFYIWLRRNHFPAGFRTLCCNCNQAKGWHRECTHVVDVRRFIRQGLGL